MLGDFGLTKSYGVRHFLQSLICRTDRLQNPYKHSKHLMKFGLIINLIYHILKNLGVEHMH
jgi:hypothetical protein